jgi:hypothetical protein
MVAFDNKFQVLGDYAQSVKMVMDTIKEDVAAVKTKARGQARQLTMKLTSGGCPMPVASAIATLVQPRRADKQLQSFYAQSDGASTGYKHEYKDGHDWGNACGFLAGNDTLKVDVGLKLGTYRLDHESLLDGIMEKAIDHFKANSKATHLGCQLDQAELLQFTNDGKDKSLFEVANMFKPYLMTQRTLHFSFRHD